MTKKKAKPKTIERKNHDETQRLDRFTRDLQHALNAACSSLNAARETEDEEQRASLLEVAAQIAQQEVFTLQKVGR